MADAPAPVCPLCGESLAADATQCTNCGAIVHPAEAAAKPAPSPDAPECPECGERVRPGAPECPACGYAFAASARAPPVPSIEEAHLLEELEWAIAGEVAKPPPPLVPEISREVLEVKRRLLAFVAAIPGVSRKAAETVAEFFLDPEQIGMTEGDELRALPGVSEEEARRILEAVRRRHAERTVAVPAREVPGRPPAGAEPRPATTRLRPPPVEVLRDFAAIGTVAALPVAALAALANVAGHAWGHLYLFGVLLGLAATLTAFAGRTTPGTGGRSVPLASLAWIVGLLALTASAALPLLGRTPGLADGALGLASGTLALGGSLFLALRRVLSYAAEGRLAQADGASVKREFDEADRAYDRAIALSRWSVRGASAAWAGKGATLVAAGRFSEAVEALDRALESDPTNEVAWINKGTALSRLGRMNEALRCFNAAIKANARYEVAWNNKGNALARLGKHDLALQCYERALDLDPAFRTAWVNRGFVLARLGRFRESAECANEAIRLTAGAAAA